MSARRLEAWIVLLVFIGCSTLLVAGCPDESSRSGPAAARRASARTNTKRTPGCGERDHLVLLGTGTPNVEPDRQGPSLAVVAGDRAYLVDAGTGVVRRAAAAFRAGVRALSPVGLEYLFLTHLHSDHTLGYQDLIFSPWVIGRAHPLRVFGPRGTEIMTRHLLEAFQEDTSVRIDGLERANPTGHRVQVTEYSAGKIIYKDDRVSVRAFAVHHGSFKHAHGLRFVTPDLDICISGDTAPYREMSETYRSCDLLVHEVFSDRMLSIQPPSWQTYHRSSHTPDRELGEIAARTRPGMLVLTHQLLFGSSEPRIKQAIRDGGYTGPLVYGRDLTCIGLVADFRGQRAGGGARGGFVVEQLGR